MEKCVNCGRFVSVSDLRDGLLFTPDTEFSAEKSEFLCPACRSRGSLDCHACLERRPTTGAVDLPCTCGAKIQAPGTDFETVKWRYSIGVRLYDRADVEALLDRIEYLSASRPSKDVRTNDR